MHRPTRSLDCESTDLSAAGAAQLRVSDVMLRSPKLHIGSTTVADLHRFFADDHVHMALVVDDQQVLLSAVERADLATADPFEPATAYGRLIGRTVLAREPLLPVWRAMVREDRRRLVVVTDAGRVAGLLCLKRHGGGFCSDVGVAMRSTS